MQGERALLAGWVEEFWSWKPGREITHRGLGLVEDGSHRLGKYLKKGRLSFDHERKNDKI